jgi:hypothetical protein
MKTYKIKKIITLSVFLIAINVSKILATEIDSFTQRYLISDGVPSNKFILNEIVTNSLLKSINITNLKADETGQFCHRQTLIANLKTILSGSTWYLGFNRIDHHEGIYNPLETDFDNGSSLFTNHPIRRLTIDYNDSIFSALNFIDSWSNRTRIGSIIKWGDLIVGSDKFSHFLSTGYMYFDLIENNSMSYQDVLDWGIKSEEGIFGLTTTGIFSFGDLTANVEGLKFWRSLTPHYSDSNVIIQNKNPLIACNATTNKWEMNTKSPLYPFDWDNYITSAWDEGYHCNKFKNEQIKSEYLGYLSNLEANKVFPNQYFTCPLNQKFDLVGFKKRCEEWVQLYSENFNYKKIINPICW